MKIPALGDVFTFYRTHYLREIERAQRLESDLLDARNELRIERERAQRAESERSEVYQRFINYQARAQVFPMGDAEAPAEREAPAPIAAIMTGRGAQVKAMNEFMRSVRSAVEAMEAVEVEAAVDDTAA